MSGRLSGSRERGFTLVELIITLTVLAVVCVALMGIMFGASRSKTATMNQLESIQAVRAGLDLMTRDMRSAGYGADLSYATPQSPIAYVDSMQVLINANLLPFPDNVSAHTPPLAYNPAGNPRPKPLDGTSYAPPIKYRTGAEVIRWTLDVNNDGVVDASDLAAPDGADAQHTPNPNDYVLVRQVYGDSTGNVAGANGGTTERVALVDKPGGSVPPMFTVYFKGSSTPWDWKNGPVPANQLANIVSIGVELTASSAHKNANGIYPTTTVRTQVATSRNVPGVGGTLYTIDGYVYNDKNKNRTKDAGEPGIANAYLLLGTNMSTRTDATGHYSFQVENGTYRLKQIAPTGYGVFTNPDSTILTVGPPRNFSFADTARTGGFANVFVFHDLDGDGYLDYGEGGMSGIKLSAATSGDVKYTDGSGKASLFLNVGAYTITMTPPESLFASTPNPVIGSILNGDTVSVTFGLRNTANGTVTGRVYRDVNKNGIYDAGESGIANVWVGLTKDGGATITGYATTDASGNYSITAPINDPPHTTPYMLYITPPSGYFATSSTAISPVWITDGGTVSGKDFGVFAFQLITLQAARVLSLATGDMVERDWPLNNTASRVQDLDLVLGSDANGTDQVSVWFNKYNSSTLFNPAPDYTRTVGGSVFALAVDTLDSGTSNLTGVRADVVAGTNYTDASKLNWYFWINQGSNGNEGYLPSTPKGHYTKDKNDVTAVLTGDLWGGSSAPDGVDVLLGCATRGAGTGSIELWSNNNAKNTEFAYQNIYPSDGQIPGNNLGEVNAMALADFDGDGKKDLVVVTKNVGSNNGQILFFRNMGRTASPVFLYQSSYVLAPDVPTSVAVADVDGDGYLDVVVGTQSGVTTGHLQYWRNTTPSIFDFKQIAQVDAPGLVASVVAVDLGGGSRKDVAVGYRTSSSGYGGGIRIYYTDMGTISGTGVDPTGGSVVNFVPTITTGNFNYGVYPATPFPPFLDDIAAGVKISDTTGALVVILR
jgi:prepilin-type N-terminal cleavage/methylation domain-containing protein